MGLVDVGGDFLSAPGDLTSFTGGDALPSPLSLLKRSIYPVKIGDLKLPGTTAVNVKVRKNIIVTEVPGSNGTVKEQISHPDYEITIEGVYAEKNNKAVLLALDSLVALFDRKQSLKIVCPYTERFGITEIALQTFEPTVKKGYQSVIWFKYEGLSDNSARLNTRARNSTFNQLRKLIGL